MTGSTQVSVAHAALVSGELSLPLSSVTRMLELLAGGATVPFIARYRKEATGALDDAAIQRIADHARVVEAREDRRASILESLSNQGVLTPALARKIQDAATSAELEDLYLPFRPKRRTRAQVARERGLQPLADALLAQPATAATREILASPYIDASRELPDSDAVLAGARDIVAETISERAEIRAVLRKLFVAQGELAVEVARGKSKDPGLAKYQDHVGRRERAENAPSHRIMAAERGEAEGYLKVAIDLPRDAVVSRVREALMSRRAAPVIARELTLAIEDAVDRLLLPSLEAEYRRRLKQRADEEAIQIFSRNLMALLLAAPLGEKPVVAIDPGLRTGCKVVALDDKGDLKAQLTIYPHTGREADSTVHLLALLKAHPPAAIAIGNGTAGRETETFVRKLQSAGTLGRQVQVVSVSEAGASVYSASEIAREELPDVDVSLRGAVSIGRRLQDPLAELVKIDPKSIGVGQYQHDVDQTALAGALERVVEAVVNRVGVNLNTASPALLRYIAGLGPALANAIVTYRAACGGFRRRSELRKVPRLGAKAFEQCAGFLRIRGGPEPLDASAVHPERYDLVARMAKDMAVAPGELIGSENAVAKISISKYVDEKAGIGLPTLQDIALELRKPGRDPRAEFAELGFDPQVTEISHLKPGMSLRGIVTNVAAFGAFVDIGVHQDGLVHVSELAHRFVKDPAEVVKVGDQVLVKVISVDEPRRRIALSMKARQPATTTTSPSRPTVRPEPFNAPRRR